MLAGIFFDSTTGEITVAGDSGANIGRMDNLGAATLRVSLNGVPSVNFIAAGVSKLIFIGFGGNDQFINTTAVDSMLFGHNGNDLLIGGRGIDNIVGGNGDDNLDGGGGDDRIVGAAGNDVLEGGDGNDRMFGGDGTNTINGGNGNDQIFGGDDVDTIDGGLGNDGIYALGGDDIINANHGGINGSKSLELADLVLGGDGDDTITGFMGLKVFWGGNGDDMLIGGTGENRLHGQNGDDTLTGNAMDDYLAGNLGDDTITGSGGNDFVLPGFGDDIVETGEGTDIVAFTRPSTSFYITVNDNNGLTVFDRTGVEGTDVVDSAEFLRFTDDLRQAKSSTSQTVTIQPVIASNAAGNNTSEFFGDAMEDDEDPAQVKMKIDHIFLHAGIDIKWLPEKEWNNTFANVGNGGTRPTSDLNNIVFQGDLGGLGSDNPLVLDAYFVEIAPGFGETGEGIANGFAFVDENGIGIHIGDTLVLSDAGRDVIAHATAQEIAHNLGLNHVAGSTNLMSESGSSNFLSTGQVLEIRGSTFSIDDR